VASATVVVAYLKMRSRGFREPFALAAEIARLERARSGRLHADLPAFRMELEDFRVLMELDPDPANRAAMAGVFLGLGDDPLMLNPVSRIFYLLCQKRAEEGAVQAYLTAARRLRRLEEEKSFGNNDVRTVEELRRLPEIRKECGEKRAAAVRILSLRSLDLAGLWSSL
jgi:hypothetical protein